jgi:hypothetical protein
MEHRTRLPNSPIHISAQPNIAPNKEINKPTSVRGMNLASRWENSGLYGLQWLPLNPHFLKIVPCSLLSGLSSPSILAFFSSQSSPTPIMMSMYTCQSNNWWSSKEEKEYNDVSSAYSAMHSTVLPKFWAFVRRVTGTNQNSVSKKSSGALKGR